MEEQVSCRALAGQQPVRLWDFHTQINCKENSHENLSVHLTPQRCGKHYPVVFYSVLKIQSQGTPG